MGWERWNRYQLKLYLSSALRVGAGEHLTRTAWTQSLIKRQQYRDATMTRRRSSDSDIEQFYLRAWVNGTHEWFKQVVTRLSLLVL